MSIQDITTSSEIASDMHGSQIAEPLHCPLMSAARHAMLFSAHSPSYHILHPSVSAFPRASFTLANQPSALCSVLNLMNRPQNIRLRHHVGAESLSTLTSPKSASFRILAPNAELQTMNSGE
eukprot:5620886-Pleurochrysis_carterae.AAC.2